MTPAPVVLLHGLGRTSGSLRRLARGLEARGHATLALDYASRRHGVRAAARHLRPVVAAFRERAGDEVAFVGHSMGGLVARVLAAEAGARAIVMLASPNHGSEVADLVHRFALARRLLGPALGDLRTQVRAFPMPDCPIGVIAGARSYLPFTAPLFPGRNDGLVSHASARLPGADWIAVAAGHAFLMNHPEVVEATAAFLARGRFPDRLRTPSRV